MVILYRRFWTTCRSHPQGWRSGGKKGVEIRGLCREVVDCGYKQPRWQPILMKDREVGERDTVERPRGYTGTAEVYLTNFEHRDWMVVKCVDPLTFSRCGRCSRYQLVRRLHGRVSAQGVLEKGWICSSHFESDGNSLDILPIASSQYQHWCGEHATHNPVIQLSLHTRAVRVWFVHKVWKHYPNGSAKKMWPKPLCDSMFQFWNFYNGSMAAVKTYLVFTTCPAQSTANCMFPCLSTRRNNGWPWLQRSIIWQPRVMGVFTCCIIM
jgi:hypothetical protein